MDGPLKRRLLVLGGAGAACAVVALGWLGAGSLFGAHPPWAIGSTNGSAWNAVFIFNGVDRVGGSPNAHLQAFDPPGLLRLFNVSGRGYGELIGSMLVPALVFGALAVADALALPRRARSAEGRRLRLAGGAWIGVWLLTGTLLFSVIHKSQLRYLDAFTPAVAAATGIAVVALAVAAVHRPRAAVALVAGTAVTAAVAPGIGHASSSASVVVVTAACATALLAAAAWLLRGRVVVRALVPAIAVAALVAALVTPLSRTTGIVGSNQQDSGHPGFMPPERVTALSSYLRTHQGAAHWETASTTVAKASSLIIRDGRPVLMLTSWNNQPLVTPARLADLVRTGQVRYVLVGHDSCFRRSGPPCTPVIQWVRDHGVDVSKQAHAGQSGLLLKLQSTPIRA
jgi:hypothetical protein